MFRKRKIYLINNDFARNKKETFLIRSFNEIKFTCQPKYGKKYLYDFILKIQNLCRVLVFSSILF
jgi:hypothetical protein